MHKTIKKKLQKRDEGEDIVGGVLKAPRATREKIAQKY